MNARTVRYYERDAGMRTALLAKVGRLHAYLIPMDAAGIRVLRRPKRILKHLEDVNTPPVQAARHLLSAGERFGITQQAKILLRGVIKESDDG